VLTYACMQRFLLNQNFFLQHSCKILRYLTIRFTSKYVLPRYPEKEVRIN
jgi:hypothetical protein